MIDFVKYQPPVTSEHLVWKQRIYKIGQNWAAISEKSTSVEKLSQKLESSI